MYRSGFTSRQNTSMTSYWKLVSNKMNPYTDYCIFIVEKPTRVLVTRINLVTGREHILVTGN